MSRCAGLPGNPARDGALARYQRERWPSHFSGRRPSAFVHLLLNKDNRNGSACYPAPSAGFTPLTQYQPRNDDDGIYHGVPRRGASAREEDRR